MPNQNISAWVVAFSNAAAYIVEAVRSEDIFSNPVRTLKTEYEPRPAYISPEQRARSIVESQKIMVDPESLLGKGVSIEDLLQNPDIIGKGYRDDSKSRKLLEFQMLAFSILSPEGKQREVSEYKRRKRLPEDKLFQEALVVVRQKYGLMEELRVKYPHSLEEIGRLTEGGVAHFLADQGYYLGPKKYEDLQSAIDKINEAWQTLCQSPDDKELERRVSLMIVS